jgi:hypothetical protein
MDFPILSLEDVVLLSALFSLEEIAMVVPDSDGNRNPGSDGFNFSFFKRVWDILKEKWESCSINF